MVMNEPRIKEAQNFESDCRSMIDNAINDHNDGRNTLVFIFCEDKNGLVRIDTACRCSEMHFSQAASVLFTMLCIRFKRNPSDILPSFINLVNKIREQK